MSIKLHPKNVQHVPAPSRATGRADYYDATLPGFVLRVSPRGARTFAVVYSRAGRTRRYTLGRTPPLELGKAREQAREVLARVQLGADPQAERAALGRRSGLAGLTLAQLGERCLERLTVRPATLEQYSRLWAVEVVPKLGSRIASEISRAEVRDLVERLAQRAPYIANRTLSVLRRVYSWGVEKELQQASPCTDLRPVGEEQSSDRVLSPVEVGALQRALEQLDDAYADATRLMLLTVARRDMVLELPRHELQDLDSADPLWVVPAERMKGRRQHVVPLSPQAVAIVRRRLEAVGRDPYLFPRRVWPNEGGKAPQPATWSSKWVASLRWALDAQLPQNANVDAGAQLRYRSPRWTIHNLRHTAATHLRENLKVGRDVVALLLAHGQRGGSAATKVYDRAELLPERRAALVAWAERVERLARLDGRRPLCQGR